MLWPVNHGPFGIVINNIFQNERWLLTVKGTCFAGVPGPVQSVRWTTTSKSPVSSMARMRLNSAPNGVESPRVVRRWPFRVTYQLVSVAIPSDARMSSPICPGGLNPQHPAGAAPRHRHSP